MTSCFICNEEINKNNLFHVIINGEPQTMCVKCYEGWVLNKYYEIGIYVNIYNHDNDLVYFEKIDNKTITEIHNLGLSLRFLRQQHEFLFSKGSGSKLECLIKNKNLNDLIKDNWICDFEIKCFRKNIVFICSVCGDEYYYESYRFLYKNGILNNICRKCHDEQFSKGDEK